jgi:hypothetical protein
MMQRGFSTRTEPMPMEKALATTIRGGAIPSRYKTMKNPTATTPEVIHKGMRTGQTTAPPATPTTAVATPCMAGQDLVEILLVRAVLPSTLLEKAMRQRRYLFVTWLTAYFADGASFPDLPEAGFSAALWPESPRPQEVSP